MRRNIKDIVFLGGGHSNTLALRELALRGFINRNKEKVSLKLISDNSYSAYSGTVPGLICGYYRDKDCFIDLKNFCKKINIDFLLGKAISLLPNENKLILETGEKINYDILSINIGSKTLGTSSIPGVIDNTITTRPISCLLSKIEKKEKLLNLQSYNQPLRIGIVGGGLAGIELAFSLKYRFKKFFSNDLNINILNKNDRIIENYNSNVSYNLYKILSDNQIKVQSNAEVKYIKENTIFYNENKSNEFDIILWATGSEANELNLNLNLPLDKNGWISVKNTLQSIYYDNIFGSGDCIQLSQFKNFPPKSGVYAVREASILSKNIENYFIGNKYLIEYIPQNEFLALITLGNNQGFGTKFGLSFKGKWVWNMKKHIDLNFIKLFDENMDDDNEKSIKKDDYLDLKIEECIKYLFFSENEEKFDNQMKIIDQLAKDEELLKEIKKRMNL